MLNAYLTQLRDVLHDPNDQMWTVTQKTNYINEARNRVCDDTYCLRQVNQGLTLTQGQELYNVSSIPVPAGYTPVNVMQIDLYYGTLRLTLDYYAFRDFGRRYRAWQTFQSRPLGFTRMGANLFYVGPVPDQNYTVDIICSMRPPPLVTDSTPEPMPAPFTDLVQWWGAYKAKFVEQSYKEAEMFKNEYFANRRLVAASFMNAVIPSVYSPR